MDDRTRRLAEKLRGLLSETAEAAVELSRADGTVQGVPHYSIIEAHAHDVGKQLSRQIQQRQMNEVAAGISTAPCPTCGKRYQLHTKPRDVTSIDGSLSLQETVGYCPKCRRSFFPSATGARI
jgi:hypothetical protein